MKSFEYDLRYIQAGMEVMEHYLLSDEVFWPLSAHPPEGTPEYPQLTLGGFLLVNERLAAYPTTHPQEVQLEQVIASLDRIRSKWRVAWEKKAWRSYNFRLRMWGDFIEDYKYNPQENADRYLYEVRLRVMLQLLFAEAGGQHQAGIDILSGLDGYLKSVLVLDVFIWEPEIQKKFPMDIYWYLYGRLQPGIK